MSNLDNINESVSLPETSDYVSLNPEEHILKIPDTYVGSVEPTEKSSWCLSVSDEGAKARKCLVTLADAIDRVFVEILSNAGDNAERSRRTEEFRSSIGSIDVTMDSRTISIKNGGVPIPVEKRKDGQWLPEFIFDQLRSSSNYNQDDNRTYCGRNGYGAKLTNIFSKKFELTVRDSIRQLEYYQVWKNNKKDKSEPLVSKYTKKKSSVCISYELDFDYFRLKEYNREAFETFAMHVANVGLVSKSPVSFNDYKLKCQDIKDYCELLFGEETTSTSVVHYEWPKGARKAKNSSDKPIIEMCVLDTPDKGQHISFVNGIPTRDGGVHVNAAYKTISQVVVDFINKEMSEKCAVGSAKITLTDIKAHVTLVLNATLINPKFSGQTKSSLGSPTPKIGISKALKNKLLKWDLVDRLKSAIMAKHYKIAKKEDGVKKKHIKDSKTVDANNAGTKKSKECTLLVTEGDSAATYGIKWISFAGTQDTMGVFALGGKPLNSLNAMKNPLKVYENKVFSRLKKTLGLQEGVDYSLDKNYNKLRYGKIYILTDADVDGYHIKGLVLLYFRCFFPELLRRGVVYYVRTPIIRTSLKKKINTFYTIQDFETWKSKTSNYEKYTHEYYKGLGTSTDDNIIEDIKTSNEVNCVYDNRANEYLELAFGRKRANDRKEWLAETKPKLNLSSHKEISISTTIDEEIIDYSIENNTRSIPNYLDGLKPGQRKILFTVRHNAPGWTRTSVLNGSCKKKKVAQMVGHISSETAYHHGEACVSSTLINMTQRYTGSNNLPYFVDKGQFGTRWKLGKDSASPRYIFFAPQKWLWYVYRQEDVPLYEYIIEEGEKIEPKTLFPIIPMHIINGCRGIGSAWKTYIPNHDVMNVCDWLLARLKNKTVPILKPSYKGFTGDLEYYVREPKNVKKETPESDSDVEAEHSVDTDAKAAGEEGEYVPNQEKDEEFMSDEKKSVSLRFIGKYHVDKEQKVHVTEIPIGRSINWYNEWLGDLVENKEIVDYRNLSNHDEPHFVITGFQQPSKDNLKLLKSYGMTSLVLMNESKPIQFSNIVQILETFYQTRLKYYQKRKDLIVNNIKGTVDLLNMKIKFIMEVAKYKRIQVLHVSKESILKQMAERNIPGDILDKVKLVQCTLEEIEKLQAEVDSLLKQIPLVEKKSASDMWISDIQEFVKMYKKEYL